MDVEVTELSLDVRRRLAEGVASREDGAKKLAKDEG